MLQLCKNSVLSIDKATCNVMTYLVEVEPKVTKDAFENSTAEDIRQAIQYLKRALTIHVLGMGTTGYAH